MGTRMKTLSTVHFQARVPVTLFWKIDERCAELGIDRNAAYERLKGLAVERSRKAVAEMHAEAAGWTAEQWAALGLRPQES